MSVLANQLSDLINQAQLEVTEKQILQLVGYVDLLHKWNKAYNLTSVREPSDMLVKHIMDSIVTSSHIKGERLIDVGTGPGLPGIPLAIINPNKSFTLLDSLGKRIRFIKQVIHELKIDNVTTIQSRVEQYTPEQGYDVVLSRAFASLKDMVEWCHHLPNQQGVFLALKGQVTDDEVAALPSWCQINSICELQVPELEGQRHLVTLSSCK